jgi:hypothetical protein
MTREPWQPRLASENDLAALWPSFGQRSPAPLPAASSQVHPQRHQPSDLWKARRQGEKMSVNPHHRDYPSLLAEVARTLSKHKGNEDGLARRVAHAERSHASASKRAVAAVCCAGFVVA